MGVLYEGLAGNMKLPNSYTFYTFSYVTFSHVMKKVWYTAMKLINTIFLHKFYSSYMIVKRLKTW